MQLQLIPDERAGQWTNDDWATPWDLIRGLEAEFGTFDLDPCCTPETAKAPKFYTRETDGLAHDWHGRVFCNQSTQRVPICTTCGGVSTATLQLTSLWDACDCKASDAT